ncbi:hypothetical protein K504DRAFT_445382 [Pleomassaria siparia CBS 279.74]|uniref:DUF3533 domain-containing protein n=1 Tax=Pleomassaria siparia CBS 279.74 TaxID=1314801 RepID=A0A6G1KPG9_9PLEO|nr:hypothetical protein K504DRAFT_445382 [Pleomassaria siparia CBS 279.74]
MVNVGLDGLRRLRQKPTLSSQNRTSFSHSEWAGIRKRFIGQTAAGGIAFMFWFLICCSYLYGTLYGSNNRHENIHVLAVDYDGGVIGQAMEAAYQQLKGPSFFTLDVRSSTDYPTEADMYRGVWEGKYWGAISANKGASDRLSAAIQGGDAASTYNPSDALSYIWNQQEYTAFANSVVQASMEQLVVATRIAYNKINGTQASQSLNQTDPAAVQALLNPIQATTTNIEATMFGSAILLNTVSMAMPILQQFFFLLVLNGAARQHQLYNKMTVLSSLLVRRIAGFLFTLGASLCQTGYFWAFREGWDVTGTQFVLTWMTFWLLMHVHLLILDSVSTVAPLPVMPFVVLLWVFLNISSTLSPLELQAGFYHWGIALPSNNAYSILITIWTRGANNHVYRALPILLSWWILMNLVASVTHLRACHLAYKMDQDMKQSATKGDGDDEAKVQGSEEPMSRQTTLDRPTNSLEHQRSFEEVAKEQRQVYGPSIPPFA